MTREDDREDAPMTAAEERALDAMLDRLVAAEAAARPALPPGLMARVAADAARLAPGEGESEGTLARIASPAAAIPARLDRRAPGAAVAAQGSDVTLWLRGGALAASLALGVMLGLTGSLPQGASPLVEIADLLMPQETQLAAADGFFSDADAPF